MIVLSLYCIGNSTRAQTTTSYSTPVLLKKSSHDFAGPQDLIITPDGGYLLVTNTGNAVVKVLQPGTLNILGQFGTGYLKSPRSIEIDKNGMVMVIDDGNKRVTSSSFKGVHRNGTIHVEMIEQRIKPEMIQVNTQKAIVTSGQNYIANTAKNQINIFSKSEIQIGVYQAEGIKSSMAVETVGR